MNFPAPSRAERGVSFVEVMIVVLGTAIIATMALPGVQRAREMYRLTTARDELISNLEYARSEAVKRDSTATVVLSSSGNYTLQYSDNGTNVTTTYTLPQGVAFTMPSGATAITVRYASSGKTTMTSNDGTTVASVSLGNTAGQRNISVSVAGNITSTSTGS